MTHAERILRCLDGHLTSHVELTLYGRAALTLGFEETPQDYALSHDVDAVLWLGQAEALNESTDFWQAVEKTNDDLAENDLYVSHFFAENQVALLPDWRDNRVHLKGDWARLDLYRLGDLDMVLSKLMRDDPIDQSDALFVVQRARLSAEDIRAAIARVVLPDSEEIHEQFLSASARLLKAL